MRNKNEKTNANYNVAANCRQQSARNLLMKLGLLLAVIFGQAMTANAATYTVDNTSDDATKTACTVPADDCSLRGAINNANASPEADTIDFDLSGCPCTITLTGGQLVISNNGALTTINGPGADELSVSGNNQSRVFFIQTNNFLFPSNAAIADITITGGSASTGGGIHNQGTLTLNDSTVSGNSASNDGGGIFNFDTMTLINSTVSNNSAIIVGGGIHNNNQTLTLISSTVSGNSAEVGGGIASTFGTLTLTDSTVSGNSASDIGGGIYKGNRNVNAGNSIFADNTAPDGADFFGSVTSQGYNLFETAPTGGGTVSTDLVGVDPMLGPLQDNGGPTFTHALLPGSPAIDTGNSTLTTDQRGFDRPVDDPASPNGSGNLSDIGAFEVQTIDTDGDGIPDSCDIDQNPGAVDFDRDGIVDSSTCDTEIGPPVDKEQCKNGGWMRFNNPSFRNQGQCVSFVVSRRP